MPTRHDKWLELGVLTLFGCALGAGAGLWVLDSSPSKTNRKISSLPPAENLAEGEPVGLPAAGGKSSCMAGDRAGELIKTFKVRLDTFNRANGDLSLDLCDPDSRIRKTLDALELIQFRQFLPYPPGIVQGSYADFVSSRIVEIGAGEDSDCPADARDETACYVAGSGTIILRPKFFTEEPFTVGAAATLIHEARHAEGFPHIACTGDFAAANTLCDASFSAGGAFAVEDEYLARVALYGKTFSAAMKEVARQLVLTDVEHYKEPLTGITVEAINTPDGPNTQ